MPVVNYAFASLVDRRPTPKRVRRRVPGNKICAFCGQEYEPAPHERPERQCCIDRRCEDAWELAKQREANRRKTPRPVLTKEPPRPLRAGNS